jgi:hypothetical protein
LGWAVAGEEVNLRVIFGAAVIVVAVAIVILFSNRSAKRSVRSVEADLLLSRSRNGSLDKYPGMPMRKEIDLNGQKFRTTLDSAEEANLSDDEFAIPADYKQITSAQSQEK